jgi:hemoglobin-like flavoprotein
MPVETLSIGGDAARTASARRCPGHPKGAHSMTPSQVTLIRESWSAVEPIADTAAGLFYGRLFELDPAIERLFRRTDMAAQRKVLMQTLTVVVKSLDKLDQLVPAVQALGRRHAGYGVREEHYATVGSALLWTLEQGLGAGFTPAVREAWTLAYGTLASVMIDAAKADSLAAEAAA